MRNIKRTLIFILIFALLLTSISSGVFAYAVDNEEEKGDILIMPSDMSGLFAISDKVTFDEEKVFEIFSDFQEKYFNRASGTNAEKECAEGLKQYLIDFGYSEYQGKYISEFSTIEKNADGTSYLTYSQNVAGIKYAKNSTDKQIIIGAHYDNTYSTDNSSEGAYDNGSGVASVMALAQFISKVDFDVNVVIVFFGMEEKGIYGSENFVSKMSDKEKENTLLMINFDSVACGDYLYLFSDEIPRTHENIFFDEAAKINFELRKMPYDKKSNGNFRSYTKPFSHIGLLSDNAYFVDAKIPSVSFIGYNLESKQNILGEESEEKVDVMHTPNDTLKGIIEIYGKENIQKRMASLLSVVASTLLRSDFVSEMEYSKEHPTVVNLFYKDWFIYTLVGVFSFIFILAVVIVYVKLSKKEKIVDENSTGGSDAFDDKDGQKDKSKEDGEDNKDVFDI